eukprot:scpid103937/ scgid27875/ 
MSCRCNLLLDGRLLILQQEWHQLCHVSAVRHATVVQVLSSNGRRWSILLRGTPALRKDSTTLALRMRTSLATAPDSPVPASSFLWSVAGSSPWSVDCVVYFSHEAVSACWCSWAVLC